MGATVGEVLGVKGHPPLTPRGPARYVFELILLAAVYAVSAKVSLLLAFAPDAAAPVWPGSGIALVAMLLRGYRMWPAITAATYLLTATSSIGPVAAIGIAIGNTLEPMIALALLRRFSGPRIHFGRVRDVVGLIVLAGMIATSVSAVLGVASLVLTHHLPGSQLATALLVWWTGNLSGCVVVAPFLLAFREESQAPATSRRVIECLLLGVLVLVVCELVFGFLAVGGSTRYPLTFLLFPPLVWASLRFGHRGASGVSMAISLLAVVATSLGLGPFAHQTISGAESVALLAAFMTTLASSGLLLSAVIDERERAAHARIEAEAKYHLVIDHASDGIFLTDTQGRYLEANARGLDMLGYSIQELLSLNLADLLVVDDEDPRPPRTGELKTGTFVLTERRLRRKDGVCIPVEISAKKLPDGRFLGIVRDIRERKQSAQSVREFAERFEIVSRATNDAVWDWNIQAGTHWWNDGFSTLFGYPATSGEQGNDSWTQRIHPDDQGRVMQGLTESLDSQRVAWSDEYRFRRYDGAYADIFDRGFIMRDPSGRAIRMIGAMQDISAKKRLERQSDSERAILELLTRGEPLDSLLTHLALRTEAMFPDMLCSVLLLDASGKRLTHGAAPSLPASYSRAIDGIEIGPSVGSCGTAAFLGTTVVSEDIATDPRWENVRELALSHNLRACFSVPILSSQGAVLGTFAVYYHVPHAVQAPELAVFERAAHLASLAIERRQAEESLRQSEARFRRIMDSNMVGMIFWNRRGGITDANDAFLSLSGYSRQDVDAGSVNWLDMTPPEYLHLDEIAAREVAASGRCTPFEKECIRKDGSRIAIQIGAAVFSDQPDSGVAFILDISGRKATEKSLRDHQELLNSIIDSTPSSIFALDANNSFTLLNDAMASFFGRSKADLLGKSLHDVFPAELADSLIEVNNRVMSSGQPISTEEVIRNQDGDLPRVVITSKFPLRDHAGNIKGLGGVATDITERKRAEEQRTLMIRELDHRVKNNLAIVLSIADHTARSVDTIDEFSARFIGRIMALARVHGLLAQSRWEGTDLGTLVERTLQPHMDQDHLRIRTRGEPCQIPARATGPLCMTLHELATNAAKYGSLSSPTGVVDISWVTAAAPDGSPVVRVTWVESGGPPVQSPAVFGFGTNLIQYGMAHEIGASVTLEFRPGGVWCLMVISLVLVQTADPASQRLQGERT